MTITGMVAVNITCSDFPRSKASYECLGFREVLKVPEQNTAEVAAGITLLSEPAVVTIGGGSNHFVCFRDPGGTIVELAEQL